MDKNDLSPKPQETKQASTVIAIGSIIGLTTCFISANINHADIPVWLYAIFGGGILGTDNIIRIIRSIFRIS